MFQCESLNCSPSPPQTKLHWSICIEVTETNDMHLCHIPTTDYAPEKDQLSQWVIIKREIYRHAHKSTINVEYC